MTEAEPQFHRGHDGEHSDLCALELQATSFLLSPSPSPSPSPLSHAMPSHPIPPHPIPPHQALGSNGILRELRRLAWHLIYGTAGRKLAHLTSMLALACELYRGVTFQPFFTSSSILACCNYSVSSSRSLARSRSTISLALLTCSIQPFTLAKPHLGLLLIKAPYDLALLLQRLSLSEMQNS